MSSNPMFIASWSSRVELKGHVITMRVMRPHAFPVQITYSVDNRLLTYGLGTVTNVHVYVYLLYSGKLSREKTFANFAV